MSLSRSIPQHTFDRAHGGYTNDYHLARCAMLMGKVLAPEWEFSISDHPTVLSWRVLYRNPRGSKEDYTGNYWWGIMPVIYARLEPTQDWLRELEDWRKEQL